MCRPAPADLRSRDFGSPQCRLRFYVLAVRSELISAADFAAMMSFLKEFLPHVHKPAHIDDVVKWVSTLDLPSVTLGGSTKER